MWQRIGECPSEQCYERLEHAGLSGETRYCFVAGAGDHVYVVWDIQREAVAWRAESIGVETDLPPLDEWVDAEGCVHISDPPVKGKYRVFGQFNGEPRVRSKGLDIALSIDEREDMLVIEQASSGAVLSRLPFGTGGSDWAYASLADDDSLIAVLEPYSVTFFQDRDDRV